MCAFPRVKTTAEIKSRFYELIFYDGENEMLESTGLLAAQEIYDGCPVSAVVCAFNNFESTAIHHATIRLERLCNSDQRR